MGIFIERNLIKAELATGVEGVWNDDHDLLYDGVTYKGLNNFIISPLSSTSNGSVEGVSIRFSGLDQAASELVSGNGWHQKPIYITRLILHPETKAIELEIKAFAGRIDQGAI